MTDHLPRPPSPFGKPPRPARPRRLDRDGIVEAARLVLLRVGLAGVTMRAVAEELGTGAASLYAHVSDKDELVELLFDRVIGEVPLPEIDAARWRQQLDRLGRDIRGVLAAHRDIARVSLGRIPTSPNVLLVGDRMFGLMLAGGVPVREAALAVDTISLYVAAAAYEESIWGELNDPADPDAVAAYLRQIQEFYAALPADRYPHLSAHTAALLAEEDNRFEFGLGLLIGGVAALTADPPPAPDGPAPGRAGSASPEGRPSTR